MCVYLVYCERGGSGIAQLVERRTHDWKVVSSNLGEHQIVFISWFDCRWSLALAWNSPITPELREDAAHGFS